MNTVSKKQKPYGLWSSPITPASLASSARLTELAWHNPSPKFGTEQTEQADDSLVWLESRYGVTSLMQQNFSEAIRLQAPRALQDDRAIRGRIGYGGGELAAAGGAVYFTDGKSGRLFRQPLSTGSARAVTPAFGRAAAPQLSADGKHLIYVHEDESDQACIAVVDAQGRAWPQKLVAGADFYAYPRFSPDGLLLAYVAWNHPDMPWDAAGLFIAALEYPEPHGGAVGLPRCGTVKHIAGGTHHGKQFAAFQPQFTPDGNFLLYVSDQTGWLHLHAYDLRSGDTKVYPVGEEAEHAGPPWLQEMRSFAVTADSQDVFLAVNQRGFMRIYCVHLHSGRASVVEPLTAYTSVAQLSASPTGRKLAFIGSSSQFSARLVVYDDAAEQTIVVARTTPEQLNEADLSRPVPMTYSNALAKPKSAPSEVHGLFYPAASARYACEGLPPLIVLVHGGPTSQATADFKQQTLFFSTRGYAVLHVNHRGSTGYGRAYMEKLRGQWGVADVEDAVAGALHLAQQAKVDARRMVIMGGSAGGYTTLQTMVHYPEVFAAGISLYGIANLFKLNDTTHKFESSYNDSLLGPLPAANAICHQRSPFFFADRIKRPLAVFQGSDDDVVPKEQSDLIVEALVKHKVPHIYHVYEGEGHGFRKPETLRHFYAAVEGFLRDHVVYGSGN